MLFLSDSYAEKNSGAASLNLSAIFENGISFSAVSARTRYVVVI